MTLGEMLRAERKKMGISSREAARRIGINHSSLQSYEGDRRKPQIDSAIKLEDFYGIKIDAEYHGQHKGKPSLCWDCKKAVCGCSWSRDFIPVEGWQAVPTTIRWAAVDTSSYHVIKCPLFERDEASK